MSYRFEDTKPWRLVVKEQIIHDGGVPKLSPKLFRALRDEKASALALAEDMHDSLELHVGIEMEDA